MLLTIARVLVFVSAVVAVDVAVADEQVTNALREVASTTHLAFGTLVIYTRASQSTLCTIYTAR